MSDVQKNIDLAAYKQNRIHKEISSNIANHTIRTEIIKEKEIIIKMGRSTLFFIMLTQLLIVALFFIFGFTVAWNYFSQTTPASFATPINEPSKQIIDDIADLSRSSS